MSNPADNEIPAPLWTAYADITMWLQGFHTLVSVYQMHPTRGNLRMLYRHYALLQEKARAIHDFLDTENQRIPSGEEHLPPDEDDPTTYHEGELVEVILHGVISSLYGDDGALLNIHATDGIPILLSQITRKVS